MPVRRHYFINSAVFISALVIIAIFVVPSQYRLMLVMGWYLALLLIGLSYYKSYQKVLTQIKMYDGDEDYQAVIKYLEEVSKRGYNSFVFDSYGIYAHYMLGEFTAYEKLAAKMSQSRTWKRPKFESFRSKVADNLACIAFLRKWAETGQLNYQGRNVLIIQSIADYQENNQKAILARIENYPEQPLLKRACLFALSGKFEWLDGLYKSKEANTIFEKIREREIHG